MTAVLTESTLSTSAAARMVGRWTGRPTPAETIVRWHKDGLRSAAGERVYLEMVRVGGRLVTSEEALGRFFDAVGTRDRTDSCLRQPGAREKTNARARGRLRAGGF
jgi:hypothetical protein